MLCKHEAKPQENKVVKVVYNKNYDKPLRSNRETCVHRRHSRALVSADFISLNNLKPEYMWSYFNFKNVT